MKKLLLAALLAVLPLSVFAQERPLNDEEIRQALTGNTLFGTWNDREWKGFYAANGVTYYQEKGEKPTKGRWRAQDNKYCSVWPPNPTWFCYDMTGTEAGDRVTFLSPDGGDPWPARVETGDKF